MSTSALPIVKRPWLFLTSIKKADSCRAETESCSASPTNRCNKTATAPSKQPHTSCFVLQKLLQPYSTQIRRGSLSKVTILLCANAQNFNPSKFVYRQDLTSMKPAKCIWSRTLANSSRSSGLEVTALEGIIKTQIQVISTHVMSEVEEMAAVSLDMSNSHLDILAKHSNCLHLQSCCFGSPRERVVMLMLYMVWKSYRSNAMAMKMLISFSTHKNILHFHLRHFSSPTMSSSHWTSHQSCSKCCQNGNWALWC